ncbi:hypothetical protein MTR_5g056860 [Medicago truncatula]|uniref:Uncharacterized protein n=1 Tax=Medicago truncatula TaxID=3880 RepID=G7K1M1_MEDTR|nr:hypothetical protein MTR_5g056860 [Medicago truncatula]
MASSSSAPGSSSNMQQQEAPAYEIKGRTMSLEEWELKIQSESPVDFNSLAAHNCDIGSFYEAQGLGSYFNFLNGPTYQTLDVIVFVLRRPAEGDYKAGITKPKDSPWNDVVNKTLYNKVKDFAYADMNAKTKVMLKIQNDNLLLKGGGSDQPSLKHKILLHFFITGVKVNVPRYIFRHMVHQLRESQLRKRCWVPYGRLLSEIFHQGGIIKMLNEAEIFSDEQLGTVKEKIINGETLRSMQLIGVKDLKKLPTDLKASDAKSALIPNFPPICKQDPLDVQMNYIREHFERTQEKISLKDVQDQMFGGALPVAKSRKSKSKPLSKEEYLEEEEAQRKPSKRTRKETKVEVAAPKPKKSKANVSTSEEAAASEEVPASEEDVQKQRNKKSDAREAALQTIRNKKTRDLKTSQGRTKEYAEQLGAWEEEPSPQKAKKAKNDKPSVMPMFVPTEEQWQYAREYTTSEMAKMKQMRKQNQREEQLKAAGYELAPEKAVEMATLAAELEQETVKEGVALLSQALKGKHASGATSSEPASKAPEAAHPEAHSSGTSSKAKINIQIPDLPFPPSSPSSSSTESDNIPINQHLKKFINEFRPTKLTADGRIDYELNLPVDHFFQPAISEAVSIQHPEPNHKTNQTNPQNDLTPQKASEVVSEATISENPPQQESSTLHNLERHLDGEMQPTPTKASKTVPEKTVLENQQTETQTETQTIPKQTVPEQVASDQEQCVSEQSVHEHNVSNQQQTTTEQSQPNTEQQQQPESPTIDLTTPEHQTASDRPSTSQTTIPEPSPIPDTILESDYIDE